MSVRVQVGVMQVEEGRAGVGAGGVVGVVGVVGVGVGVAVAVEGGP